jgi:hypothetical protein
LLSTPEVTHTKRDVSYGNGLNLGDCAATPGIRKEDGIVIRFGDLNKNMEN